MGLVEDKLADFGKVTRELAFRIGNDTKAMRANLDEAIAAGNAATKGFAGRLNFHDKQLAGTVVGLNEAHSTLEDVERRLTELDDILYGIIAHLGLRVTWNPGDTTCEQWTVEKANDQDSG
jgi:hypothetical protein